MKRKWHKVEELTIEQILENLPFHVWGLRAGLHYSTSITALDSEDRIYTFKCEDGNRYDLIEISHIMPFPACGPRPNRR